MPFILHGISEVCLLSAGFAMHVPLFLQGNDHTIPCSLRHSAARGATWEKVTPKKLLGPKRDYDVMNAKIIEKYDCHTTTAALCFASWTAG